MEKCTKRKYQTPTLEILIIELEQGIAGTSLNQPQSEWDTETTDSQIGEF